MQIYLHFYLRSFVRICKIFEFPVCNLSHQFYSVITAKNNKSVTKKKKDKSVFNEPSMPLSGIIVTNLLQLYLNKFIFCVPLRWMDGSQLLFQSWQENQPDFKNFDENCAFMTYHNGECTEIWFSFTEIHTQNKWYHPEIALRLSCHNYPFSFNGTLVLSQ